MEGGREGGRKGGRELGSSVWDEWPCMSYIQNSLYNIHTYIWEVLIIAEVRVALAHGAKERSSRHLSRVVSTAQACVSLTVTDTTT